MYGRRGMERINSELNRGNSIQGARHYEAERRWRAEARNRAIKKYGSLAASAAMSIGIYEYQNNPNFRDKVRKGMKRAKKLANINI